MKMSTWNLFRFRNIAVVALALGILAGIWLADLFKGLGFGLGPGSGGDGNRSGQSIGTSSQKSSIPAENVSPQLIGRQKPVDESDDVEPVVDSAPVAAGIVKVLIDDRSYYTIHDGKKQPIDLDTLVERIEQTQPNEDGLRAIVERTHSSRVSAELKLFEAIKAAGVSDNAVYLTPQAVD